MSAIDRAKFTIDTGGKARYIRHYINGSNETGWHIDLSDVIFETNTGTANYIKIFNSGPNPVYVAFDSSIAAIDTDDWSSFNFKVSNGVPFSEIEIHGEADTISFKCAEDERADIEVLVW